MTKDQGPSMQDILEDLRGVISGSTKPESLDAETDVLELTEDFGLNSPKIPQQQIQPQPQIQPAQTKTTMDSINSLMSNTASASPPPSLITEPVTVASPVVVAPDPIPAAAPNASVSIESLMSNSFAQEEAPKVIEPVNTVVENHNKELNNQVKMDTSDSGNKAKLIADSVVNETSSYIKDLVNMTISTKTNDSVVLQPGIRLEDLVKESIKPYLTEWLEKNLPHIVKDIVQKEIRRIIPKDE